MAADGNMTIDGAKHRSDSKIFRFKNYIVGLAGDDDHIQRMLEWLRKPREPFDRPPRSLIEVETLILYRTGRITWFGAKETEIHEDYFAIGSGDKYATAAMDTLEIMGLTLDPRTAVQVACRRDQGSGPPIHYLRWRHAKEG